MFQFQKFLFIPWKVFEPWISKVSKIDCLRFVMCLLPAPVFEGKPLLFLLWPLTVLMNQTRQVVHAILHWRSLRDKAGDSDSHYLLALATLGKATQIGLFLFVVTLPKVTKESTATCHHRHKRIHIRFLWVLLPPTVLLTNVANVNKPLISLYYLDVYGLSQGY